MNMNEEQKKHLSRLVSELDEAIPRAGATVKMVVGEDGAEDSRMIGNEQGYLRLGVDILQGTLRSEQEAGADTRSLDIDLEYLQTYDSTVYFNDFTVDEELRSEVVEPNLSRWQRIKNKAVEVGVVALVTFLIGSLVTGVATILRFLFGLLKSV